MIEAFQYDHKVVIEKVIEPLREINASVLGDEDGCRCSTLEEVVKQDEILSYDNKYSGQGKSKGMLQYQPGSCRQSFSDEQAEGGSHDGDGCLPCAECGRGRAD